MTFASSSFRAGIGCPRRVNRGSHEAARCARAVAQDALGGSEEEGAPTPFPHHHASFPLTFPFLPFFAQLMTEGRGNTFGGLSSILEKYERSYLEAKLGAAFNEHTTYLLHRARQPMHLQRMQGRAL